MNVAWLPVRNMWYSAVEKSLFLVNSEIGGQGGDTRDGCCYLWEKELISADYWAHLICCNHDWLQRTWVHSVISCFVLANLITYIFVSLFIGMCMNLVTIVESQNCTWVKTTTPLTLADHGHVDAIRLDDGWLDQPNLHCASPLHFSSSQFMSWLLMWQVRSHQLGQ